MGKRTGFSMLIDSKYKHLLRSCLFDYANREVSPSKILHTCLLLGNNAFKSMKGTTYLSMDGWYAREKGYRQLDN